MKQIRVLIISFVFFNGLIFCNYGKQKKYVIGVRKAGFFSNFLGVLNHLRWCEKNKKIPVIYWDKVSLYYTGEGFNGSKNSWEYYFEPVSNLRYKEGDKIIRSYCSPDGFQLSWLSCDCVLICDIDLRKSMHRIIKKYIKIKKIITNKIINFYQKYMQERKTIGIHIRGTDKVHGKGKEAPYIPLSKFIKIAEKFPDYQLLIASDEYAIIDELVRKFGKRVIYYDAHRSSDRKPIHSNENSNFNKAQLGEEVLIETILLSKCDIFIHAASNVSTAVLFFNPELPNIPIVKGTGIIKGTKQWLLQVLKKHIKSKIVELNSTKKIEELFS